MQHTSQIKSWLGAMRLRTLPLSFSCILMGSAIAYSENMENCEGGYWNWTVFYLTLLTTLLLQVLSNLANDYGDAKKGADNEGRIGPERAIQSGAISPIAMKNGIILFSILSFFSGMSLLFVVFGAEFNFVFLGFILLGMAAIAAAIKYTMGKKAYGYSGLGDVFVFLFFGIVGVLGTIYLQLNYVSLFWILPAITMGCFATAVLNLNNMRDRENDKNVGKNTLVVHLGFQKSKYYHFILFALGYTCLYLGALMDLTNAWPIFVYTGPIFLFHLFHLVKVFRIEEPKQFDPELKKIALSTFALALILFVISVYQIPFF